MFKEFREFAMRGNVVDLAVGLIIGAAFGAIVQSMVADIIMPIVATISGGIDFSNHFVPLSGKVTAAGLEEARKQGAVLAWGHFLTLTINFIIVAWVMFLLVKGMNRLRQKQAEEPAKAAPGPQEVLLAEIRDILRAKA